jgi:protein TonB
VFDEVTKTEGGKRVARRGAFLAGSTVAQVLFVAFLVVAGERIRAAVKSEPVVEVKFVKAAAPKPPAPPPPPPAAKKPPQDRPKTEMRKAPPMAMVQPKTVEDEIKPADPNEPEEEYDSGEGDGTGVIGGVVGGQAPQARGFEEAPLYMTSGFKAPRLSSRTCLAENLHIPAAVSDFVSGAITVKFAVYSNGAVGAIQILTPLPDARIGEAIKRAISACEWVPGSDHQGRPIAIWVIQPVRFAE